MTINIGHLYRKRTVRDLKGNIKHMSDEASGGDIIRNYKVVNQEAWDEIVKREEDKKKAATAAVQVQAPQAVVEERQGNPGKIQELENRLNKQDEKLDAILAALKK